MGIAVGALVSCGAVVVPAMTPLVGNMAFLAVVQLVSVLPGQSFGACWAAAC